MSVSLFEMFREFEAVTIVEDAEGGPSVEVAFRSLTYDEHGRLSETMEKERELAKQEIDTTDTRKRLAENLSRQSLSELIDLVVEMERPLAAAVSDLAPTPPKALSAEAITATSPTPEGEAVEKKEAVEKAVMTAWELSRREELSPSKSEVLIAMLVNRQVNLAVSSRANQKFAESALVIQTVDLSRKMLLSQDPKAANFIGHLAPKMRQRLLEEWQHFMERTNEKAIRRASKDPRFLRSGMSPSVSPDSPGATASTLSTSPTPSPSSTPSEAGSIT